MTAIVRFGRSRAISERRNLVESGRLGRHRLTAVIAYGRPKADCLLSTFNRAVGYPLACPDSGLIGYDDIDAAP